MNNHYADMIKIIDDKKMKDIFASIDKAVKFAETKHPSFAEDIKHQALILLKNPVRLFKQY